MKFESAYIKRLVDAHMKDQLDEAGRQALQQWLGQSPDNQAWFDTLTSEAGLAEAIRLYNSYDTDAMLQKLNGDGDVKHEAPPVVHLYKSRRKTKWYFMAASLVLLVVLGGVYVYFSRPGKQTVAGVIPDKSGRFKNDVPAPDRSHATLVLGDGTSIVLDSASDGRLVQQGNTNVVKNNSRLVYETGSGAGAQPAALAYNTVSTPRGGQYQIVLPDGTKVWLDAASSLRFPTAFTGAERKVFVTGQVYFEVATNKAKPFIVSLPSIGQREAQSGEIEVLGTNFNINAYNDEANIKTTLLEGSIRLVAVTLSSARPEPAEGSKGPSTINQQPSTLLSPHQQAILSPLGRVSVAPDPDIEATMAWKNGQFRFNGDAPLEVIMAQVARWYDVEVVFKNKVSYPFVATINRNLPLSELLKLLEMTGLVRFEIEGKKVTVMKGM